MFENLLDHDARMQLLAFLCIAAAIFTRILYERLRGWYR